MESLNKTNGFVSENWQIKWFYLANKLRKSGRFSEGTNYGSAGVAGVAGVAGDTLGAIV
jgi:hypothetical protein